jgi:hypothetical protein
MSGFFPAKMKQAPSLYKHYAIVSGIISFIYFFHFNKMVSHRGFSVNIKFELFRFKME